MATNPMSLILRHLRRWAPPCLGDGLSDAQLLTHFAEGRDEAAFAALVHRYAPMVWGVCRRVLNDNHDAEDAFQATFLVLVRKARSVVPRERVANWLHGVARTTALRARSLNARRKARERQMATPPEPAVWAPDPINDLRSLLDTELSRLPEKYRLPLVLCDLEERPLREAAHHLGWPQGTVAGRLARARAMLAKRLARRGLALTGAALAAMLAERAAPAAAVSSTIQAARLFVANPAASGAITARVAVLTEGVLRSMMLSKAKAAAAAVVLTAVSLTALGGGVAMTYSAAAPPDNEAKDNSPPPAAARPGAKKDRQSGSHAPRIDFADTANNVSEDKTDLDRLQGVWTVISIERDGKPDMPEKAVFMVDGNRVCWQTPSGEKQGGLYLDPTKRPRTFDVEMFTETDEGIYVLEGENILRLCIGYGPEAKRPSRFATRPGSRQSLIELKKLHGKEVFPYRRPDGTRTFPTFVERVESKEMPPPPPQSEPPPAIAAETPPAEEPDGERLLPSHQLMPRQAVVRLKRDLLLVRTAEVYHEPVTISRQGRQSTSYQRVVVEKTRHYPVEAVKVFDVKGKRIPMEKLAELLKKETLALVSTDLEAVNPINLRLYKEGTLLFVFPPTPSDREPPNTPPPGVGAAPAPLYGGLSPAGPIRATPALPVPEDGGPVPPPQPPQLNYPPLGSYIPTPNPRYAPTVPLSSAASPPPATAAPPE